MDAGVIARVATVVCALACAALVDAERRGRPRTRVGAKLVASAAFLVAAAAIATAGDGDRAFGGWIFAGLVLGAVGDVCLLGLGRRAFLGGLVAFLLGHLAYVAGMAALVPPARWPGAAGAAAALPIVGGLAALAWLWPRLGALRVPVIAYVAAIAAMVVGALAVAGAGALPAPQRTYLAAGAALFFVSDLAVARERIVAREVINRMLGLPAYYAAQLLIAWSLG